MPFFEFRQNNSGGGFDFQPDAGISVHVIVEADDATEANQRAEAIGLYFDGVDKGWDCGCCGDRWYEAWANDGDDVPSIYGTPLDDYEPTIYWMKDGAPNAYVHYKDGRVVPALKGPRSVRKERW